MAGCRVSFDKDLKAKLVEFNPDQIYFEMEDGSCEPAVFIFDEEFYLQNYPEVAYLVKRGRLLSGAEHFAKTGIYKGYIPSRAEQRLNFYKYVRFVQEEPLSWFMRLFRN